MRCWHTHRWRVIDRKILDSPMMQLLKAGAEKLKGDEHLHHRPVIVTYRCDCGAEKVVRL